MKRKPWGISIRLDRWTKIWSRVTSFLSGSRYMPPLAALRRKRRQKIRYGCDLLIGVPHWLKTIMGGHMPGITQSVTAEFSE